MIEDMQLMAEMLGSPETPWVRECLPLLVGGFALILGYLWWDYVERNGTRF